MSQSTPPLRLTENETLPGLPRGPLSATQQMDALRRVQAQAEQRVKLGVQLFKAAEAHAAQHQKALDEVRAEQRQLHEELKRDMTSSLHTYDQWISKIDQDLSASVKGLEKKITDLQSQWDQTHKRIEAMLKRSEAMLDQARYAQPAGKAPVAPPAAAVVQTPPPAEAPALPAAPTDFVADGQATAEQPSIYTQVVERLRSHGQ